MPVQVKSKGGGNTIQHFAVILAHQLIQLANKLEASKGSSKF
jgi:hypothetical protein